jgi:ATP-dependent Lon protease
VEALPVLPLKETVVFPDAMTPLAVGRERSLRLVGDVVGDDRRFVMIASRDAELEEPGWDDIYGVGTVALIHKLIKVPDGTMRILVEGRDRVKLERPIHTQPYLRGAFTTLRDVEIPTPDLAPLAHTVLEMFARIVELGPYQADELQLAAADSGRGGTLCHLVASTLRTLALDERQAILEEVDVERRLRTTAAILGRELELAEQSAAAKRA